MPQEAGLWQNIEQKTRQIFHHYNYKEIRTPIFEETELFAKSMGQTSEVVQKQMLNIASQKTAEASEAQLSGLSLRPEGTAAVVRSYLENDLDRKESLTKQYYIGPMFRGERPQKGRLRQFHQIGAEIIGPLAIHPYLDAEIIELCVYIIKELGVKEFELQLNTLGTSKDRANFSQWLRDKLKNDIKNLDEHLQKSFQENVFRILDSKDPQAAALANKLKLDRSYLNKESVQYYEQVKEALDKLGVRYVEKPGLVRGLDYYEHTVFEIIAGGLGSQNAVAAGGRYNDLIGMLDTSRKEKIGGLGFSIGIERVILAGGNTLAPSAEQLDAFVVALGEQAFKTGFKLMFDLRHNGASCDIGSPAGSMKSQMRQANKLGAKQVIIIGEDELKKNVAIVKDMSNSEQSEIKLEVVINHFKK